VGHSVLYLWQLWLLMERLLDMKVYIIKENSGGRIYEIYLKKTTAEKVLESLNKHGISDYFISEYEVEEV